MHTLTDVRISILCIICFSKIVCFTFQVEIQRTLKKLDTTFKRLGMIQLEIAVYQWRLKIILNSFPISRCYTCIAVIHRETICNAYNPLQNQSNFMSFRVLEYSSMSHRSVYSALQIIVHDVNVRAMLFQISAITEMDLLIQSKFSSQSSQNFYIFSKFLYFNYKVPKLVLYFF